MNGFFKTFSESFTPLRFRDFRIYLGGQAVSLIGTWLQVTAQGWLVWTLTGSEAASGTVAMLSALPILLFGPWAGVWAERLDRRKLLIGTQVGAMLLAFILAFLVQTQTVQIWHVYIPPARIRRPVSNTSGYVSTPSIEPNENAANLPSQCHQLRV